MGVLEEPREPAMRLRTSRERVEADDAARELIVGYYARRDARYDRPWDDRKHSDPWDDLPLGLPGSSAVAGAEPLGRCPSERDDESNQGNVEKR